VQNTPKLCLLKLERSLEYQPLHIITSC